MQWDPSPSPIYNRGRGTGRARLSELGVRWRPRVRHEPAQVRDSETSGAGGDSKCAGHWHTAPRWRVLARLAVADRAESAGSEPGHSDCTLGPETDFCGGAQSESGAGAAYQRAGPRPT